MIIKELYRKFRRWQENPAEYKESTEEHHCCNCERDFRGDYCPTCGQKWDTGPASWSNLRQEWMNLWGLGSRSLPFTIVQLLLRPGYLIGEYISGKRRNCFPPFKMLILVALVTSILDKWLGTGYTESESALIENPTPIDKFKLWLSQNTDYGALLFYLTILVPTFILFRYAPRHTRHTLPQSFFIQVFNATQFILMMLIFAIGFRILMLSDETIDSVKPVLLAVQIPFFLFINYKQLFGYGVWGTIWRTFTCFIIMILVFVLIIEYSKVLFFGAQVAYATPEKVLHSFIKLILFIIFILCGTTFINRRGYKKRMKAQDVK